jgi:hypothetical protein
LSAAISNAIVGIHILEPWSAHGAAAPIDA